jgi:hypothetical protein
MKIEEMQQRLAAIEVLLDKAELLAAQVESGEKSAAVVPAIRAHIEAARKLATATGIHRGHKNNV